MEHVAATFGAKSVRSLARFVSETPPMTRARQAKAIGRPLDMTTAGDRRELFEDIRLGISQLDHGRRIPFSFKRRTTSQTA